MHLVKRKDTENSRKKAMSSPKDEPGWKYGQLTLKIGLFFFLKGPWKSGSLGYGYGRVRASSYMSTTIKPAHFAFSG